MKHRKNHGLIVMLMALLLIFTTLPSVLAEDNSDSVETQTVTDSENDSEGTTPSDDADISVQEAPALMSAVPGDDTVSAQDTTISGKTQTFQVTVNLYKVGTNPPTSQGRTFKLKGTNRIQVSSTDGNFKNIDTVTTNANGMATFYVSGAFNLSHNNLDGTVTVTPKQPDDGDISPTSQSISVSMDRTYNYYDGYKYSYEASTNSLYFQIEKINLNADIYVKLQDTDGSPMASKDITIVRSDSNDIADTVSSNKLNNVPYPCLTQSTDANGITAFSINYDALKNQADGTYTFTYDISPVDTTYEYTPGASQKLTVTVVKDGSGYTITTDPSASSENPIIFTAAPKNYTTPPDVTAAQFEAQVGNGKTAESVSDSDPDLYQISLTAPGATGYSDQTMDFVLTIDCSGSMAYGKTSTDGGQFIKIGDQWLNRIQYLQFSLTRPGGFIDQLYGLSSGTKVRISYVAFSSTGSSNTNKTGTFQNKNGAQSLKNDINALSAKGGTDYTKALNSSASQFAKSTAAVKKMVFLSDGAPTAYQPASGDYVSGKVTTKAIMDATASSINSFYTATENKVSVSCINYASSDYGNVSISGADFAEYNFLLALAKNNVQYDSNKKLITNSSENAAGYVYPASDAASLTAALESISTSNMQDLTITDTLSQYVEFNGGSFNADDLTVTIVNDTDSADVETLKINEGYTAEAADNKLAVKFIRNVPKGYTAKVSFLVNIDKACQDLLKNVDSSSKDYPSNDSATASAKCGSTNYTGTYNVPVVAASGTSFTLSKVSSSDSNTKLTGAEFTLTRSEGNVTKTFTTGENGEVVIEYLPHGTYTLTETKAPDGYISNAGAITFTVDSDNSTINPESVSGTGFVWTMDTEDKVTGLTVDNKPNVTTLTITKKVTGNTGSVEQEFAFDAAFKKDNDENASNVTYKINGGDAVSADDGAASFKLKNSDTVEITMPSDVKYTVVESSDSAKGYTTTISADPSNKVSINNGTRTLSGTSELGVAVNATYNNDASSTPPTALMQTNLPFMLLLAGAGILGLALIIRKRTGNTKSGF